jgi:hypothetical protein
MIVRRFAYIVPVALFVIATAMPAHALASGDDGGCDCSPENPTVVLGLVVSAASIGFMQIRNRIGNRRRLDRK